jgi:hypothetical protein
MVIFVKIHIFSRLMAKIGRSVYVEAEIFAR